jgi:hypothetical protein
MQLQIEIVFLIIWGKFAQQTITRLIEELVVHGVRQSLAKLLKCICISACLVGL